MINLKEAILLSALNIGLSAIATGAVRPLSEVTYGVTDKIVDNFVPSSLRKPLNPDSNIISSPYKINKL